MYELDVAENIGKCLKQCGLWGYVPKTCLKKLGITLTVKWCFTHNKTSNFSIAMKDSKILIKSVKCEYICDRETEWYLRDMNLQN